MKHPHKVNCLQSRTLQITKAPEAGPRRGSQRPVGTRGSKASQASLTGKATGPGTLDLNRDPAGLSRAASFKTKTHQSGSCQDTHSELKSKGLREARQVLMFRGPARISLLPGSSVPSSCEDDSSHSETGCSGKRVTPRKCARTASCDGDGMPGSTAGHLGGQLTSRVHMSWAEVGRLTPWAVLPCRQAPAGPQARGQRRMGRAGAIRSFPHTHSCRTISFLPSFGSHRRPQGRPFSQASV